MIDKKMKERAPSVWTANALRMLFSLLINVERGGKKINCERLWKEDANKYSIKEKLSIYKEVHEIMLLGCFDKKPAKSPYALGMVVRTLTAGRDLKKYTKGRQNSRRAIAYETGFLLHSDLTELEKLDKK